MQSMEEREATWWALCRRAWAEEDPVKFLDVTMQIVKFLAHKQQRLDAAFDEAQQVQQARRAEGKNTVN
jgi:hypothetical protein